MFKFNYYDETVSVETGRLCSSSITMMRQSFCGDRQTMFKFNYYVETKFLWRQADYVQVQLL